MPVFKCNVCASHEDIKLQCTLHTKGKKAPIPEFCPHEILNPEWEESCLAATSVIDLDQESWKQIKQAASESKWIPKEYFMNDWVSDVCQFLREGE